ncbi:NAD(P)H-binding protein [Dactylosporangium sp. CA-139066]|uniref:NmrA family NAD(P)-binding protein n=1 Tax=Dactylosporangium sp. CA-139066 TaxID=3239930 RepID=UPI003D94DE6F
MIIVSGGTGQLGRQVVEKLLELVPAERVGVSVRDPGKAGDLAARGVRVRRGDFAEPETLAEAFDGAERVLVVSVDQIGEAAVARHAAAIDAAAKAGAGRILYTSHQAANPASAFAPMPDHAATERHLQSTGVPYVALRNGFYASTVPHLIGGALQTGELLAPADGPVSWTTHADLAEAAARVLADDDAAGFDGPTPPLTAAEALDLTTVAALLSVRTGRPIRRVVAGDEEWVAATIAHGVPAEQANMLLGMFVAARNGEFAVIDPALDRLLGRRPATVGTVMEGVAGLL